ncbi:tRNA-binding protein [Wenyingzhuangia marina]|uniref:tRNA-binding protein n=1 Tax=Wenyingzhuangia marina TaxID=1195760 RepID=A0A1M5W829_9FLAO|nr:tRNA-binding protein [Wenyingzhuangia marina]GGF75347.1 tRNA-binding protein [Wenyingzhuangia marina]SHH83344.1 tRNA-binding protein [Wenyingzhuangia marina]
MENTSTITWEDFAKVDMRIGTIINAEIFKEVKRPAYKLMIDFGEIGIKKSSAQITKLYQPEKLIGKQVVAVVNFPAKQIANMMSECLVIAGVGQENDIVLIQPERKMLNGTKIG